MRSDESATGSPNAPTPDVIPLPAALYELNGRIYELYQGGQLRQQFLIRWERLKRVWVTRGDDCSANVHINHGRPTHF